LLRAHLNPLNEVQVGNLMILLASHEGAPNDLWVSNWDSRFTQWRNKGITGTEINALFTALDANFHSGARIRGLFDFVARPTGLVLPSETVFRWIETLSATLNATQIEALFTRLITTIGMDRAQVRQFVT